MHSSFQLGHLKQLPVGCMVDTTTSLFKTPVISPGYFCLLYWTTKQSPTSKLVICSSALFSTADLSLVTKDADFLGLKWTVTSGWSSWEPQFLHNLAEWLVQWIMWAFVMPSTLTVCTKDISELIFSSMINWLIDICNLCGCYKSWDCISKFFGILNNNAIFSFAKSFLLHNGLAITTNSIHYAFSTQSCKELPGKLFVVFLC